MRGHPSTLSVGHAQTRGVSHGKLESIVMTNRTVPLFLGRPTLARTCYVVVHRSEGTFKFRILPLDTCPFEHLVKRSPFNVLTRPVYLPGTSGPIVPPNGSWTHDSGEAMCPSSRGSSRSAAAERNEERAWATTGTTVSPCYR